QDLRGAVLDRNWMGQRVADHGDANEVALRDRRSFADRVRHFVGLTKAGADTAAAVPYDDEGAKVESPSALHDLGDAVDVDDLLLKVAVPAVAAVAIAAEAPSLTCWRRYHAFPLKLESGLARGVRQRLHPA